MGLFTQIVILIIVLACMVMVLLAIRQLSRFQGFDDSEETFRLKEDVKDRENIVSNNSIFSTLVDTTPEEKIKERNYNSNSKDPFSPNE